MRTTRELVACATATVFGLCSAGCGADANRQSVSVQRAALSAASIHTVPKPSNSYTLFETLQVRPLALSPNGKLLFAVNTPDNRLEIFRVNKKKGLSQIGSVAVGLEPIAVAARSNTEVWVVNHLSDSVSIVQVGDDDASGVVRTLLVGDEPRDIVLGGADRSRAFVTTAHRGQNSPDDPESFTPTAGRADVWVFDANNLGTAIGGERLTKITLFADTPRALAVSADGSRVYAAPFFSGNQTTVASADAVRHVYADRVDPNNPNIINTVVGPQRITSLIVKYRPGPDGVNHWFDAEGTNFDNGIRVILPDYDVFTIDATANPPAAIASGVYAHVGTTIFNMAVNPVSGIVYVSNTDAHNDVRFEGHNPTLPVTSVRGNIVDSRISVVNPSTGSIVHNNLNSHIVNGVGDASLSRAFPQDMAVSSDGKKLLVVAQGSGKLALYDTAGLEAGAAAPSTSNQVALSAGGPSGVVLDEANNRAYVLTRFDNGISTVSLGSRSETSHLQLFNPEPVAVTDGRRFLHDAASTSENGTQACSSCHIGGDFDALAWDLGNPGGSPLPITSLAASETTIWTFPPSILKQVVPGTGTIFDSYQPLKGPMSTQSLRGLDNHGGMHWRGDRNGAVQQNGQPFIDPATNQPVVSAQPNSGIFDEFKAFESFNVAFPGLVGRAQQLATDDMAAFTTFALDITYPPNPIRNLDNSLTATQQVGHDFYFQTTTDANGNKVELPVDRLHNCNGCHTLDPNGNAGSTDHPGFFGTRGRLSFENLPQTFKVAHLRNAYQKVGMFASSPDANRSLTPFTSINPQRSAVRGFGYQPDGAVGSIEHHLSGQGFIQLLTATATATANPGGIPTFTFDPTTGAVTGVDPAGFPLRRAINSFLLAYDSNMKPIVGQQLTLQAGVQNASADARLALLEARASAGDCDLVVKARVDDHERGFVYQNGSFVSDRTRDAARTEAQLRALLGEDAAAMTFTCVPPGSGWRIGVDRDADGFADGDELALGTDPTSASSHP
jgi:6-phosphogluconolactonase (cycloisomerase 2 family)